jgi:SPP1 family predicted phage head-tail adaptor
MAAIGGGIRAGELRHVITWVRPDFTDDGHGGQVRNAATIATLRAKVEGQDGREAVIGHALEGISTYRITIRWRTGLLSSDQIHLDDGTILNVTSISDPEGRRRQLQVIATTASAVPE